MNLFDIILLAVAAVVVVVIVLGVIAKALDSGPP